MTRKSELATRARSTSSSMSSPSPEMKLPTSAVWRIAPQDTPPEVLYTRLREGQVRLLPHGRLLKFANASADGLVWESDGDVPLGRASVAISGKLMVHSGELTVRKVEGTRVETSQLEKLQHVRTRSLLRVKAPAGLKVVANGEVFPANDLTDDGASFVAQPGSTFSVGDTVPIAFNWHDRLRVLARLTIRHVSRLRDRAGALVGGSLDFDESEDRDRHREELDAICYPFTRIGATYSRDLWELFIDSGYFHLSNKKPEDFIASKAAFFHTSRIIAKSPRLGVQIVYPTSRGVDCSYSVIAEYPRTCMSIHTGRRSTGKDPLGLSGRIVLRDAYLRVLDWIRRCEADWMSVWVQDAAPPFIKGMLLNFVQSRVDGRLADIHKFHALEISCAEEPPRSSGFDVRHAQHRETEEVYERFGASYPQLLASARCWHDGVDTSSHWAEAGLWHKRAVIVARQHDELKGAAICEATPEGIHVYGLFDVVHLVYDDHETERALLDAAVRWYRSFGKRRFIYAASSPHVDGAMDLGLTHGTILSTKLFRELYEHVWDFMAPRS